MVPAIITFKLSKASVFLSVKWDKDSTYLGGVRIEWHNMHKAMYAMPSIMDSKCLINVNIMIITISLLLLLPSFILFFKKRFSLFLERGEGREKEGEKHQCSVASPVPPTGDLAHNPGMCPDWDLNW